MKRTIVSILIALAIIGAVAGTGTDAGAASYEKRARRAASCAYKIATVIDYEVAGNDFGAESLIATMSYKCLAIGADAEDLRNADPYGDYSLETITAVAEAYRVDPTDMADAYCARYGC